MIGSRDIEQLSAYLDGQLSPSDSARLKSRIQSDPELAATYNDIRSAYSILRKLPSRKAPRNFVLTRQMVGLKPPLPRSYPVFRFATTFATILFAVTVAINGLAPRLSFGRASSVSETSGSGPTILQAPFSAGAAATQAPAATEAPAAVQAPAVAVAPAPTEGLAPPAADSANAARITETPNAKQPVIESQNQPQPEKEAVLIPVIWQMVLLIIIVIGVLGLFLMNRSAKRKWQ